MAVWGHGCGPDYVCVATKVNYGDRPAGCVAIAAFRETAEKFREEKEEAAPDIRG
jgi:hypothetical protein